MLTFHNPAGFWALLAIPVILAIHFLQRKARELPISTMFLLGAVEQESRGGPRWERLRGSVPLWMQLLMVLLFTWLWVQPHWLERSAVQRVVVVLDGSVSMQAIQKKLVEKLPAELGRLGSLVQTTEYHLLDSLLEQEHLYHGTSLGALKDAVEEWSPRGGSHDFTPALRLARSLADRDGLVVLVTDHALENVPFAAKIFSVGEPLENAGFAGLTVEPKDGQWLWKATLKNYGTKDQTRAWWTVSGSNQSKPQTVTLPAGGAVALQGLLPAGPTPLVITTQPDAFTPDDSLPVLVPEPKQLAVALPTGNLTPAETKFYQQLFGSLPNVTIATDAATANVQVMTYDPLNPALPTKPAMVSVRDNREKLPLLSGEILPGSHPFMEGLHWSAMSCLDSLRIPLQPSDETLLWQGDRSLVFLRGSGLTQQLCCNFDLRHANAHKLPAFVLLVHRFFESIRQQLPLHEVRNAEWGEKLQLAARTDDQAEPLTLASDGKKISLPPRQAAVLKAPSQSGEFQVHQGALELCRGVAHFADTREGDFTRAGPRNDLVAASQTLTRSLSKEDRFWPIVVLLVVLAALASWTFGTREPAIRQA